MSRGSNRSKNNIGLLYVLAGLERCWLWIAIWVLFYLRFTDYAGIGLIESIMITIFVFGELPTGMFADFFGKKKTLVLAFLLMAVGNMMMGSAGTLNQIILAVALLSVGGVYFSGTFDAMVFDSVKDSGLEHKYDQVLANLSSVRLVSLGLASIVGGFMYRVSPALPFYVLGGLMLVAAVVATFLKEPKIDSLTFSFQRAKSQTTQGLSQLFSKTNRTVSGFLIMLFAIIILNEHVLIDLEMVAYGWSEVWLGWLVAIMSFVSVAFVRIVPRLISYFGLWKTTCLLAVTVGVSMTVMPLLGIVVGTMVLIGRNGVLESFMNVAVQNINERTESTHRATTLSTFNMLYNMPYIFGAYYLGVLMNWWSVYTVVSVLGCVCVAIAGLALVIFRSSTQK